MNDDLKEFEELLSTPEARRDLAEGRTVAALGALIAARLEAKDWSQADLARALEISPPALSRKLDEDCDMRLSSIVGILWELDIPLYAELERLYRNECRHLSEKSGTLNVLSNVIDQKHAGAQQTRTFNWTDVASPQAPTSTFFVPPRLPSPEVRTGDLNGMQVEFITLPLSEFLPVDRKWLDMPTEGSAALPKEAVA